MDINDFRTVGTVLVAIAFAAVIWWAYNPRHKAYFEKAARLPLDDDDQQQGDDSHKTGDSTEQGERS